MWDCLFINFSGKTIGRCLKRAASQLNRMAAIFWIFPALDSLPLPSTGKVGVGEGSEGVGSIALKVSTAYFNLEEGEGGKRTSRPPPLRPPPFKIASAKIRVFASKKRQNGQFLVCFPLMDLPSPRPILEMKHAM